MSIKLNREIIHYALAIVFLKGISLLMLPVVTHYMPPDDYGVLNFLVSIVAMLSIVLSFGMAEVLFRFTPGLSPAYSTRFVHASIVMSARISIIFIVLAWLSIPFWMLIIPVSVTSLDLLLLSLNLAFCVIIGQFLAMYRFEKRSGKYLKVASSQGGIQATLTLIFLHFGLSVTGVLLSGAIASLTVTLFIIVTDRQVFCDYKEKMTTSHLKYALFITLSSLFLYAFGGAENWFIITTFGPQQLAMYFVASQFALGLSLSFEPFRMWWYPKRFSHYLVSPNNAAQGAVLGCFVISALTCAMMVAGPLVIIWLLPDAYTESADYIPFLCLVIVTKTYAELLNIGCYLDESAKPVPIINGISAIVALCLLSLMIKPFGINGVLAALMLTHLLRLSMFYIKSQQITQLPYSRFLLVGSFCTTLVQLALVQVSPLLGLFWFIAIAVVGYIFCRRYSVFMPKNKESRRLYEFS